MVLYEVSPLRYELNDQDLRVYTLWRAEWEHFTKQQLKFHKQNNEWEMLGELALRLHHKVLLPCLSIILTFSGRSRRSVPRVSRHRFQRQSLAKPPPHLLLPFPNLASPNLYRQTCRLEFTMVFGIFARFGESVSGGGGGGRGDKGQKFVDGAGRERG